VSCHQGTWQFIAGDLVEDPETPQMVEHDLESIFWVLLWVCLLYMKSNMKERIRSSIIKGTMSPPVYSGSGGVNKSNIMTTHLPLQKLETETNPAMAKLLIRLHELLGERYMKCTEGSTVDATQSDEVLNKHEGVLTLLHNAIYDAYDDWWPECDPAEPQELVVSTRSLRANVYT